MSYQWFAGTSGELGTSARGAEIVADAAYEVRTPDGQGLNGQTVIDEDDGAALVRLEAEVLIGERVRERELVSGLEKFYSEPANAVIPVGSAIRPMAAIDTTPDRNLPTGVIG